MVGNGLSLLAAVIGCLPWRETLSLFPCPPPWRMREEPGIKHEGWAERRHSPAFLAPPLPAEPPTVRITEHSAKDGGTILRCWALGFYPHNILLSWWLGEKELDSEYAETRPSGDGTYQTWAAAWVPAGKKAQYTCRVQHSSLNHTFTVSWGEELGLGPERVRRGWGGPRAPGDSPMDWGWGGPFSLSSLRVLSSWTYCHGYLPRPGLAGGGWWCDLDQVHSR